MTIAPQHRARASVPPRPQPPRGRRAAPGLLGVSLATLVAVEIVLACALLAAKKHPAPVVAAAAIGIPVLVLGLVRLGGLPLGTRILLRLAYLTRRRVVLIPAAEYGYGVDELARSPELLAFFPGVTGWAAQTHEGDPLGVIGWHGKYVAILRVDSHHSIVHRHGPIPLPLDAIAEALAASDLPVDSVQVVSNTVVGASTPQPKLVTESAAELYGSEPQVRNRSCYVAVRVDPRTAAEEILARGGGKDGVTRLLTAVVSAINARITAAGLAARVLDAGTAGRAATESLYHPATAYDPLVRWVETVHDLSSGRMAHGCLFLRDVPSAGLHGLVPTGVFAYTIGQQFRLAPDGTFRVVSVLRLSCQSRAELRRALRDTRAQARRAGYALRSTPAVQHWGLRATLPLGGN